MTPPDANPQGQEESYRQVPWLKRRIGIPMVRVLLGRFGVKMGASRVFEVTDPASGQVHSTPLHVLELDGERYLVSARGASDWVQGLRAAGRGRLTRGKSSEDVTAVELPEAERPRVIGAYLQSFWKDSEEAFAVDSPDASEEELRTIAPQHPVFRLSH